VPAETDLKPVGSIIATEGVRVGAAAAKAMLDARATDGYLAPFTFDLRADAGRWRPLTAAAVDPDAWVGNLKPFVLQSPAQFRSKGPHAVTSAAYAKDFEEVKSLGARLSTTRTTDQTTAAIFWQFAPTVLYNRLARDLSTARQVDTRREARLLAMINLAAADGAISCWNDKYRWYFWRPRAAIQEAATDENGATVPDPTWEPLFHALTPTTPALGTPPFPDHPSGHGCVSGAVLRTFREFFGTDRIAFDVHSGRYPGQPRHFTAFSQAMKEVVDARVWGGIHFRYADQQGAMMGKKVAFWLQKHAFQPVRGTKRQLAEDRDQGAARDHEGGAQHQPRADSLGAVQQERRERDAEEGLRRDDRGDHRDRAPVERLEERDVREPDQGAGQQPPADHARRPHGTMAPGEHERGREDEARREHHGPRRHRGDLGFERLVADEVVAQCKERGPHQGRRDPDPAHMARPVRLERERDAAAHDQQGAE
jgi:hypothetical protein